MNFKTKVQEVKAVQSNGVNKKDFAELIGTGSHFLDFSYGTVGGPGRGAETALLINSAHKTWTIKNHDWLVIFDDGHMVVMEDCWFQRFFEVE